MRFADLIAPLSVDAFMRDYYDRRPLHLTKRSAAGSLLDWERMNALLAIRSHWTEDNLKLLMNSRPVTPDLYFEEIDGRGPAGRRADAAKVKVFLAMGASLVANWAHEIAPELEAVTASLGDQFLARAGANIYCSFEGIQAFGSHCDLHEVFAVQCEGEKTWNIYKNRAASPVVNLEGEDAQALIDASKGDLEMQVRLKPGDLLYIPRGYFHDALASAGASLHVTFSVAPLTGRILFRMLEDEAIADEAFRRYLPDGRADGGRPLAEHLASLAGKVASLLQSPRFQRAVAERQRALWEPQASFTLPERAGLQFYVRTEVSADLARTEGETFLRAQGRGMPLGRLAAAAEWILQQRGFSAQQLAATFKRIDEAELGTLLSQMQQLGLLRSYTPSLQ